MTDNIVTEKRCHQCNSAKPISDFAKNASQRDGLQTMCRACRLSYDRARYKSKVRNLAPDLPGETWRAIENFDTYEVSSEGRVRHAASARAAFAGQLVKPDTHGRRYQKVRIANRHGGRRFAVHRLVAAAFIGKIPPNHEVNHINGDKTDNRACNLEYVTHAENVRHAVHTGLIEKHGGTKLNAQAVKDIRRLRSEGMTNKAIAPLFNVSAQTIWMIASRRIWKHV